MIEQQMSKRQSLQLVSEKDHHAAVKSVHETGASSILWGSIFGLCGLLSFAEYQWRFYLGFDVWLLALFAIVAQVYLSVKESRRHTGNRNVAAVVNQVWLVFAISMAALALYFNLVPSITDRMLLADGRQLFEREPITGIESPFLYFIASSGSLLLLLYAMPTLITGMAIRFWPMIVGALLCYCFFVASLFTATRIDMLLSGVAAVCNWLVPGLLLRRRYLKEKAMPHV